MKGLWVWCGMNELNYLIVSFRHCWLLMPTFGWNTKRGCENFLSLSSAVKFNLDNWSKCSNRTNGCTTYSNYVPVKKLGQQREMEWKPVMDANDDNEVEEVLQGLDPPLLPAVYHEWWVSSSQLSSLPDFLSDWTIWAISSHQVQLATMQPNDTGWQLGGENLHVVKFKKYDHCFIHWRFHRKVRLVGNIVAVIKTITVTAEARHQLGWLVGHDGKGDVSAQGLRQAQLWVPF